MKIDVRNEIREALGMFAEKSVFASSINLLDVLGYSSEKTLDLNHSPESFIEQFCQNELEFNKDKALFDQWKTIDFLFQITDDELSKQISLFQNNSVNTKLFKSYLFFTVELSGKDYSRGKLADIARQINRLFPTPVMLMIKHIEGKEVVLSIAVINRRRNKRDADKDVLGKVTIIRSISLTNPHRGHLDILSSFTIPELAGKKDISSFEELHAAWEQVFNVELLNKNFYRELSNWYFWARQHVHFPTDLLEFELEKVDQSINEEVVKQHNSKSLIRLLTRLLFVWFIKEKDLIPDSLFEKEELEGKWLNQFEADSKDTFYYKAILQNLFFATLNQQCEKRDFRKDDQNQNITNLMRYKSNFQAPKALITLMNSKVPFMNGGLFECLDKPHPTKKGKQGGRVIMYEDGFSDRGDSTLKVPDFLFFGEQQTVDLSGDEAYGDKKRRNEKVRGIIPLLNNYKFTIVENTPIEQEIALDPELLGKVFENLLASYNPETKTTARKQTGSFYTPRTIVDYMVDESLKAYLGKALAPFMPETDIEEGLEILFAYTEKEHAFTENEKQALIEAIDKCKILDPACGSGAFPMGILHKLEFVLSKLDKNNQLWCDRQMQKVDVTITAAENIDDVMIRDNTIDDLEAQKRDIEEAFKNNELGYGRKLYLIENCIYGIDIQSIATQVSRLRFFISLIVDQKVNPEKENFGIRPLPNLEAKFVAADTLIHIEKPEYQPNLFDSEIVKDMEKELKQVRHKIFGAKTPRTKNKYRKRDKELREEITVELEANGWSNSSAKQLAAWDPYDQNASSSFFDPEWMFDLKGFDIVIGNPPYISVEKFSGTEKQAYWKKTYSTYAGRGDVYCFFYECGAQLLKKGGHLCYITSNNWMRANYGKKLRLFLSTQVNPLQILDFGMGLNFNAAAALTNILLFSKEENIHKTLCCYASDSNAAMKDPKGYSETHSVCMPELSDESWVVISPKRHRIKKLVEAQGIPLAEWNLSINRGVITGLNEAFYLDQEQRDELLAKEPKAAEIMVPLLRGRHIGRYKVNFNNQYMLLIKYGAHKTLKSDFPLVYSHLKQREDKLRKRGQCKYSRARKEGNNSDYPGQHHWLELDNNPTDEYINAFRKPKIIYHEMSKFMTFLYDESEYYVNDTCYIVTSDIEALPYLTAIFNSHLFRCCFKDNFPEILGNTRRIKKIFLSRIPIRKPMESEALFFEKLVLMIQFAKTEGLYVQAAFLEELIDACVLEIYFPKEALSKNLLFMEKVNEILDVLCPSCSSLPLSVSTIESFNEIASDPKHPIRNQLIRLVTDSPKLFAVIKKEGKV